ncbi:NADH-quinone oxidoreductase subunit J [Ancylobacter sp. MQZ15Z-1]|uniref:NADH-quinone oxidoreductase subunit J n=1 Tax=Ancylobacter mangrovi TaxID=2972472 RepID=A0A9X2PDU6_9HYPH|nr:proton-conducting transporter membrane subunit [Ancylobacter mangrovi]MCS0495559.1 NADH-quinone oxidoreductase subunit J [Ancylobacter mangrovi]
MVGDALASSPGGYLLVLAVLVPVIGMLAMPVMGLLRVRHAASLAFATIAVGVAVVGAVGWRVVGSGEALVYGIGGWSPPLGLALRADGLSAVMMAMAALVIALVALYARPQFAAAETAPGGRRAFGFWALLMGLWSALNLAFVGEDLFNLFVALELLTFAAVPLVCLDGTAATLEAALRYLVFALVGSVLYLLGVAVLYARYGTLDIGLLHELAYPDFATHAAIALMIGGLMAKAALFPLHLWLPPAHAGAPAPASAVLSALVVKAPFFIIVRLWFDVLPGASHEAAARALAMLGAAAILVCSVVALRQARLKLMIAYSTVAQVGYLFLMFQLTIEPGVPAWATIGWTGGMLQLVSHALAKAAMFLAAGLIAEALGHDRIDELAGAGRAVPVSLFAFGLAGLSLMGLPPSGGFIAKLLLLSAATLSGAWWIAVVISVGGLLAAAYVTRVLKRAMAPPPEGIVTSPVARSRELAALALALCAVALGLVPLQPFDLLAIGRAGVALP